MSESIQATIAVFVFVSLAIAVIAVLCNPGAE